MLKYIGNMDSFELKNSKLILLTIAPGLYAYSLIIGYLNPDRVELLNAPEILATYFLFAGFIPMLFKQWSSTYYGYIVFISMIIFAHYCIYTMAINDFSLNYLLGGFIVFFGGILLLAHRTFIILYTSGILVHMTYQLRQSEISLGDEGAILLSLVTIFIYSFFIQNGFIRYKFKLKQENIDLETKVRLRTKDLERRAKELVFKNKELEEFAYVVSHDLKRPLRNVHSLATWVQDDLANDDAQGAKNNLELINKQITQMDILLDGILKCSLGFESKKVTQLLDLNELVDNLIQTNNKGNIYIEKLCSLPRILADKSQMLQVFQNLVQNAIKYNDKNNVQIQIGVVDEIDHFKFSVKDNGMGISKEHFERIFKLFQKLDATSSDKESSGIGLAVVKKIIDKNGGEVWVESKEGEGATFYFTLNKEDVIIGFGNNKIDKKEVLA